MFCGVVFSLIEYLSWRWEENRLRFLVRTRRVTPINIWVIFSLPLSLFLPFFLPLKKKCFVRSLFCSIFEEYSENKIVYLLTPFYYFLLLTSMWNYVVFVLHFAQVSVVVVYSILISLLNNYLLVVALRIAVSNLCTQ